MSTLELLPTGRAADSVMLALGRALVLATSFEFDCRCLALCLRLRDPLLDELSGEHFERFVSEPAIAKLAASLGVIVGGFALAEAYGDLLKSARLARNYIAHEAAENIRPKLQSTDDLQSWWRQLEVKVREVAMGKVVLALLLPRVSATERPDLATIHGYSDATVTWVIPHGA
jgi:hypothetical protein